MKKLIVGYYKLRIRKASDEEINTFLTEQGIDKGKLKDFKEVYEIGFKSGINHVITKGLSSQKIEFGKDVIFDSAFNMGKHTFLCETNIFYKYKPLILFIIGIILTITLIKIF